MTLTPNLAAEYERLFAACQVRASRSADVQRTVDRLHLHRPTYQRVEAIVRVPWDVVGIIHTLEASGDFRTHLHNGDPLTARTTRVPKGRPAIGDPPFSWQASAVDALRLHGLERVTAWTLGRTLYELERYNGWGYRLHHPDVLSPYLWGMSTLYAAGKYVADGQWSATAVSKQIGAAALLQRLRV